MKAGKMNSPRTPATRSASAADAIIAWCSVLVQISSAPASRMMFAVITGLVTGIATRRTPSCSSASPTNTTCARSGESGRPASSTRWITSPPGSVQSPSSASIERTIPPSRVSASRNSSSLRDRRPGAS